MHFWREKYFAFYFYQESICASFFLGFPSSLSPSPLFPRSSVLSKVCHVHTVWCVRLRPTKRSKNRKKKKRCEMGLVPKLFPTSCKTSRPTFGGGREGSFWLRAYSIAVPIVVFVYACLLRVQSQPWPQWCTIGSKYRQRRLDRIPLSNFFLLPQKYWPVSTKLCTGTIEDKYTHSITNPFIAT